VRNDILFSSRRDGILHVDANGGVATVTIPNQSADEHLEWPQFLPDGRHFLYVVSSTRQDESGIHVGALNSNERLQVLTTHSYAVYAPSGHLVFIRGNMLVAQPFDAVNFRVTGDAVPLADQVAFNAGTARGSFSLSTDGVLAYRRAGDDQLTWFDRTGRALSSIGPAGVFRDFSISPDNARVAAARVDPEKGTSDIWIFDDAEAIGRRLTFEPSWERLPLWSPDGSHIAFSSDRQGFWEIDEKSASGEGLQRPIVISKTSTFSEHWSPDGRLLFREYRRNDRTEGDFWTIVPGANATAVRLPDSESDVQSGRISPDGRLLAYEAWEDGRWSVYVRSLQAIDTLWQVSPAGSIEPRWRADGRELFFLAPDLSLMAIDVQPGSPFRPAAAHRLFSTPAATPSGLSGQAYEVSSDGQRFLIKVPASSPQITVVVNWSSHLQGKR
jgi:eukaryotic-like serine/threonine-protein kinase